MTRRLSLAALLTLLMITSAAAHTGLGEPASGVHGFGHPFGGLDHVLAMIAVGLLAASLGGRALFLVPASFLAAMAVGGVVGIGAIDLPVVEIAIASSVIVLGAAVALQWRLPLATAMALVGLFALFHGHAHGAEMPGGSAGLGYAAGFLTATAILHVLGLGLGSGIGRLTHSFARPVARIGGSAMALTGLGMLARIL